MVQGEMTDLIVNTSDVGACKTSQGRFGKQ